MPQMLRATLSLAACLTLLACSGGGGSGGTDSNPGLPSQEPGPVNLTVTVSGSGTVSSTPTGIACPGTCTATPNSGTSVTLTAKAANGYAFTGWSGGCSGTATSCTLDMKASTTVSASFGVVNAGGSGKTYYVDANAANDSGTGTASSPKKYIGSAVALMSAKGGDTVIIKAGTYSDTTKDLVTNAVAGTSTAWNVIKAEVDGSVIITTPLLLGLGNHYLQFEGLRWEGAVEKGINGSYVKMLRCAFKGGPATGNTMTMAIGTNDATPGAQYILLEDSYVYGAGGRYNVLVYNADRVILRRVVVRHENGWTDTKGDPQAAVSLYNSTNVLTQNLLIVDSGASGYFEAALYHPSNSRASTNIQNRGAIILNTAGSAVGWDDSVASSGNLLQDSVIWGATSGITVNGAAHAGSINQVTIGNVSGSGFNDYSGNGKFSVTNSVIWKVTTPSFKDVAHSSNVCYAPTCSGELSLDPAANGLKWLPEILSAGTLNTSGTSGTRAGASVLKRLGVSGTLYDETGYNTTTSDNLWPWPRQDVIKQHMCTDAKVTTGFCAKTSLTQYVWEQLGNAMPSSFEQQ